MIRAYLLVLAALFGLFGLLYLLFPEPLAASAGISASAGGLTDVRATYGGFQLGFALFLGWSALAPARHPAALLATAAVVGGVGLARLFGLAVDAAPSSFHFVGLAFEVPLTLASVFLFQRARRIGAHAEAGA